MYFAETPYYPTHFHLYPFSFLPFAPLNFVDYAETASHFSPLVPQSNLGQRRSAYPSGKRIFDLVLCVSAAPMLLVLFMIIAFAIWLEDGRNPLFYQMRTGMHGKRFRMYKFRTMVPNAEALKPTLQHLNELQWPDFKIKNDPRITVVGRVLRRTSLDELPQIINVFLGEMSLVGPRPTSFSAETYEPWQVARLNAVPGLTGLWQVSGRSNLEFDERVRLDIEYINNRSVWYDLMLICKTFEVAILKREGAY